MTTHSLSKNELLALDTQALEANLTQISLLLLRQRHLLATAESCTGGMIAAACTDLQGASQWFERGFVSYSNEAKTEMLGVPAELSAKHGAVSEEVVRAMAEGAIRHSRAQVSIAVTGIAGPGGGSEEKPVGTVWVGWSSPSKTQSTLLHLSGDRSQIRLQTTYNGLTRLIKLIDQFGRSATC